MRENDAQYVNFAASLIVPDTGLTQAVSGALAWDRSPTNRTRDARLPVAHTTVSGATKPQMSAIEKTMFGRMIAPFSIF